MESFPRQGSRGGRIWRLPLFLAAFATLGLVGGLLLLDSSMEERGERKAEAGRSSVSPERSPGSEHKPPSPDLAARTVLRPSAEGRNLGDGVEGVVRDPEGRPLVGVEVIRTRGAGLRPLACLPPAFQDFYVLGQTLTDRQGRFRLRIEDAGPPFYLRFAAMGYVSLEIPVFASAGGEVPFLEVRLPRSAAVEGHVIGATEGTVEFWPVGRADGRETPLPACIRFVSDQVFQAEGIPPGEVIVRALGPGGRRSEALRLTLQEGERRGGILLHLGAEHRLFGRVIDSRGEPVPEATVSLSFRLFPETLEKLAQGPAESLSQFERQTTQEETVTGDFQGRFEVSSVGEGPFRVTARHPERGVAAIEGALPDRELVLRLEPAGKVFGLVLDRANGAPLPDFAVEALDVEAGKSSPASARNLGGGRFELVAPPTSLLRLRVVAPGYAERTVGPVSTASAASREVRILLEPGCTLDGIAVTEVGRPVSGAEIGLRSEEPWGADELAAIQMELVSPPLRRSERSRADGTFRFDSIPRGRYRLRGRHAIERCGGESQVEVLPGKKAEARLVLQKTDGEVAGLALRQEGTSWPGAYVIAESADGGASEARGDPSGNFHFVSLRRGSYRLFLAEHSLSSLSAAGSGPEPVSPAVLAFVESGKTTRADLTAFPKASVKGTVLAADGPLSGISVALRRGSARLPFGEISKETDASGRFSFEVFPGKYLLAVLGKGARLTETVDLQGGQVRELFLELPFGRVRGKVLAAESSSPLGGAAVTLFHDAEDPWSQEGIETTTASDGHFEFRWLREGRYRIRALAPGRALFGPQPLEVGKEGPVSLEVRLEVGAEVEVTSLRREEGVRQPLLQVRAFSQDGKKTASCLCMLDGVGLLRGLSPGSWTIRPAEGSWRGEVHVQVEAGERKSVVLEVW